MIILGTYQKRYVPNLFIVKNIHFFWNIEINCYLCISKTYF